MTVELALNELSLIRPARDNQEARRWIEGLVETLQTAVEQGARSALRVSYTFADDLVLAPDYTLGSWFNDKRVDQDVRTYLLTFSTQQPYLGDRPNETAQSEELIVYYQGEPGEGLRAAYLLNGLTVSVASSAQWHTPSLAVELYSLDDVSEVRRLEMLPHASHAEHFLAHRDWIRQRLKQSLKTGNEIWQKHASFWGSLAFCDIVEKQVEKLPTEALTTIVRGLFCLETYNRQWTIGIFNRDHLGCIAHPESESALQKYGVEHTFKCPDGLNRVFSWHLRLGGGWRIHFDHSLGPGKIIVGYIGKHLPTSKFH